VRNKEKEEDEEEKKMSREMCVRSTERKMQAVTSGCGFEPTIAADRTLAFAPPFGLHSNVCGRHRNKVLLFGGRYSAPESDEKSMKNVERRNVEFIVVDLTTKKFKRRSLSDPLSRLTAKEVDWLSATSQQYMQVGDVLYVTGGYTVNDVTQEVEIKPVLTSALISGLILWVEKPRHPKRTAHRYLRFLQDETFRVAGGEMTQLSPDRPVRLFFGPNFKNSDTNSSSSSSSSSSNTDDSSPAYMQRFHILNSGFETPDIKAAIVDKTESANPTRKTRGRLRVQLLEPVRLEPVRLEPIHLGQSSAILSLSSLLSPPPSTFTEPITALEAAIFLHLMSHGIKMPT
jgi:hypothetical protein